MAATHFFDGMLGRALCYAGMAIITGPATWRLLTGKRLVDKESFVFLAGIASAWAGALFLLNATTVMAFSIFVPDNSAEANHVAGPNQYLSVLSGMVFGHYWLLFVLCLGLLSLVWLSTRRGSRMQAVGIWITALFTLGILALMGHPGESGLTSWLFVVDWIHLSTAIAWLGGFTILVLGRLGELWPMEEEEIRRFSRFALVAFTLAAASGLVRLLLIANPFGDLFRTPYGWVFLGKLLMIGGVAWSAARLRQTLAPRQGLDAPQWRRFDQILSREVFFATLLVLLTALLTQLPPPSDTPSSDADRLSHQKASAPHDVT